MNGVWPLFGLKICTPRLELRYPDDELLVELVELASRGVHDPSTMPFLVPWTDAEPALLRRTSMQYYWRTRAEWSVHRWDCPFAVLVDGHVVGTQAAMADQFPALRQVSTGSWVGRAFQGQGIGTEMRHAVLHFAFAGLGAEYCLSGAFHDNHASHAVSRKMGYEAVGMRRALRRGRPDWLMDYRMSRAQWEPQRRDDISIEGLDDCLELFGLA